MRNDVLASKFRYRFIRLVYLVIFIYLILFLNSRLSVRTENAVAEKATAVVPSAVAADCAPVRIVTTVVTWQSSEHPAVEI